MSIPRSRILELTKLQCSIFNTTFNPDGLRLGNKVLRQRLIGHAVAQYYPPRFPWVQELRKAFPGFEIKDVDEERRMEFVAAAKLRGKGAPKKRTAAESKKLLKQRKLGKAGTS